MSMSCVVPVSDARRALTRGIEIARTSAYDTDWGTVRDAARQGVFIHRPDLSRRVNNRVVPMVAVVCAVTGGLTAYLAAGGVDDAVFGVFLGALMSVIPCLGVQEVLTNWFDGRTRVPHRFTRRVPEFTLTLERLANPNGTLTLALRVQQIHLSNWKSGAALASITTTEVTVLPDDPEVVQFLSDAQVLVEEARHDILAVLDADRALIAERVAHARDLAESSA